MRDNDTNQTSQAPLNPALKSGRDTVFDTSRSTPAPIDTASAKEGRGEGWPVIWLVVAVACVALTIYFVI
jgi:hypothetical protein